MDNLINKIINWIATEGIKLFVALLILYISFKIINMLAKRIEKKLRTKKKPWDEAIIRVLSKVIKISLKVLSFVSFLEYVGIETTSIAAGITSIGLAIGLALQGSLSNFAGGVIILIMHPYKIGDYIKCHEVEGTVWDIRLFYTYLNTIDNKTIIIPNGKMADTSIINYSFNKLRRLDMTINFSYDVDITLAKQIILACINKSTLAKQKPLPFININEYGDKYIQLVLKVWCENSKYWDLFYYLQEEINNEFNKNNIPLSYNQLIIKNSK